MKNNSKMNCINSIVNRMLKKIMITGPTNINKSLHIALSKAIINRLYLKNSGQELLGFIGNACDKDNLSAIGTWLDSFDILELKKVGRPVEYYLDKLESEIQDIYLYRDCY